MQFQTKTLISSIAFHFLSLPLGIFYFVFTIVGIALSLGTLVIWIGIPLLFITLMMVRGMGAVERRIATQLLRMHFDEPEETFSDRERMRPKKFWQRFGTMLRDPLTWTSLFYMILKLPLGIISFVLTITFVTISMAITLLPIVYMVNLFVDMILLRNGIENTSYVIPYFIEIHGAFDATMFARSFIGIPVGILFWIVTILLVKGLASFSGELARALLSPTFKVQERWYDPASTEYNQTEMYQAR